MRNLRSTLLVLASLTTHASAAAAGDQVIDWTSAQGGIFEVASNWSPGVVPGIGDAARFDLDANFLVLGGREISVAELMVGDSRIRWGQNGRGSGSMLQTGRLRVGNGSFEKPRRLEAPGRLEFAGRLEVIADAVVLGSGSLASQLIIGPEVRIGAFDIPSTPASSVRIILGGDPERFEVPRLLAQGSTGLGQFEGSLEISMATTGGTTPPLGSRQSLIAAIESIPSTAFPLVLSRPGAGRTITMKVDSTNQGQELVGTIEIAKSLVDFSPASTSGLSGTPRRITATDLDLDGREDLVVLVDSEKIAVYRGLGGGNFETPTEYGFEGRPVDVATGDFDGDGTTDLAFGIEADASGVPSLSFLMNPASNPAGLVQGPSTTLDQVVRSLASTTFTNGQAFMGSKGVTVTTTGPAGRGRAVGYIVDDGNAVKTAEVEVGDDPGPSDPIQDENKKDPDPPIGVAGEQSSAGFRGTERVPTLGILRSTTQGLEFERAIPLSGRAVDFVSAYLDDDPWIDCLVITDTGNLDLVHPTRPELAPRSLPLRGHPTAISLGDIDGDGSTDIVIGLADPPRIEVFRVLPDTLFPAGSETTRIVFEEILTRPLERDPLALSATIDGSLAVGTETVTGPQVDIRKAVVAPVPNCTRVDFNGDGVVNSADLGTLLGQWGPCAGCVGDLDESGFVDASDLGLLVTEWGPCE